MAAAAHLREVTLEDVLKRAEALLPCLRDRAAQTEQLRRVPDETMQDFLDAGLFRCRDLAYSTILCTRAVDRLASAVGAHGILEDTPIQRAF
jgi:Acyl-CoA dehydrogenase, C-terminal domain